MVDRRRQLSGNNDFFGTPGGQSNVYSPYSSHVPTPNAGGLRGGYGNGNSPYTPYSGNRGVPTPSPGVGVRGSFMNTPGTGGGAGNSKTATGEKQWQSLSAVKLRRRKERSKTPGRGNSSGTPSYTPGSGADRNSREGNLAGVSSSHDDMGRQRNSRPRRGDTFLAQENDRWVTVFGHDPAFATDVLRYFEQFGDIVEHEKGTSNTLHIEYATSGEAKRALDDKDMTIHNFKIHGKGEEGMFVGVTKSSEMVGFEPDPNKRSKRGMGRRGLRRRKNGGGINRANDEREDSSRPRLAARVVDARSVMKEIPARQYNCCQKIIRFLFLGA